MGRERRPLERECIKKDININISDIFRNEDIKNEVIKKLSKNFTKN